ncbi:MAG: CHC2 zinc finger domain-containing protein [Candidatus Pristimantibacillus sp.]
MKFLSEETINLVKAIPTDELAERLGMYLKRSGKYYNLCCPNPNHSDDLKPLTFIFQSGLFVCYGSGGCGAKGDAIAFYSWHKYGTYTAKTDFYYMVEELADFMGIQVRYKDGSVKELDTSRPTYVPKERTVVQIEPASADICDRTYRRFLDLCPLYTDNLEEWTGPKRQYTKQQIGAIGLRSIPRSVEEAKRIVNTLINEGYQIERVPGFTQFLVKDGDPSNDQDWYWLIAGMGKYYIPVRDYLGRIVRLRLRSNFEDKKKYLWFSTEPIENKSRGGASSGAPVNVVIPSAYLSKWSPGTDLMKIYPVKKALIIEGEHKGYICADKILELNVFGEPIVILTVPGSGNYKEVISLLKYWGIKDVALAYDIDAFYDEKKATKKNEYVNKHLIELTQTLLEEDQMNCELLTWNPREAKGLDDLFLQSDKLPVVYKIPK